MSYKEYGVIVTLVVAILTTLYNIWDRRQFYRHERNKLNREMTRGVLTSSSLLSDKYETYKAVMISISALTAASMRLLEGDDNISTIKFTLPTLRELLDGVLNSLRQNPAFLPVEIHKLLSRNIAIKIAEIIISLQEISEPKAARMQLNEIVSLCDKMKSVLEADFSKTFSLKSLQASEDYINSNKQ